MNLRSKRREETELPVTQLVSKALHHNLAIGGKRTTGGLLLLGNVCAQIL